MKANLKVRCKSFGYKGVSLHHLEQHLVRLDGRPDVTEQHLQARPEGKQRVHEVTRLEVRPGKVKLN